MEQDNKNTSIFQRPFWVVTFALTAAAVGIALLFGTATDGLINTDILTELHFLAETMAELYRETGSPVLTWLTTLISILFSTVIPMTCITIGAVLAKKHKLLTAFSPPVPI